MKATSSCAILSRVALIAAATTTTTCRNVNGCFEATAPCHHRDVPFRARLLRGGGGSQPGEGEGPRGGVSVTMSSDATSLSAPIASATATATIAVATGSSAPVTRGGDAATVGPAAAALSTSASSKSSASEGFPPVDVPTLSADCLWLTRRLGTGKFSDVFEAIRWDEGVDGHEGDDSGADDRDTNDDDDDNQLVVIKCLKPVSDRKVRREVAVLRHAQQVSGNEDGAVNVVRLLGVVLHRSGLEEDEVDEDKNENGGDQHNNENDGNPTGRRTYHCYPRSSPPPMPSLVLEHAGPNSQWLCHPITSSATTVSTTTSVPSTSSFPLSEYEIRYYVCHLLVALRDLHRLGIMHRDVKPRNVLINRDHISIHPNDAYSSSYSTSSTRRSGPFRPLLLIDLGLADFYTPHAPYNVRVASRHYKSPELLLGYPYYTPSLDLWGVGCVLAGLLLRREPFFRGRDNPDQLLKIVSVLGTRDLDRYVDKYGITHPAPSLPSADLSVREEFDGNDQDDTRGTWQSLPNERIEDWNAIRGPDCPTAPTQGLDLLNRLLVYDHEGRCTAEQAIDHPFFDPVRERVSAEIRALRQVEQWKRRKAMPSIDPVRREEGLPQRQPPPIASSISNNDSGPDRRPAQRPVPESALSFLSSPLEDR